MFRFLFAPLARAAIVVAVIGSLLLSNSVAAEQSGDQSAGNQPALIIFQDAASAAQFAIAPWADEPNAGSFTLTLPGSGSYAGNVRLSFHANLTASVTGLYTAAYTPDGSDTPVPVVLHMAGTIDPVGINADLSFRLNSGPVRSYRLKTSHLSAASAPPVAQQATDAINAQDWNTLYSMSWSIIQASMTQTDFVQSLSDTWSNSYPRTVNMALSGLGSVSATPQGYDLYQQPIVFTMRAADGTLSTVNGTLDLVSENGQWRFGSADPQS